jgi:ComF family protein
MVHVAKTLATQLLLPPTCVLCGNAAPQLHLAIDICTACADDLPKNFSACTRCAEPLPTKKSRTLICGRCLQHPPRFETAFCAFRYGYPVDHLVRAFKFHRRLAYGRVLGELLARSLSMNYANTWPEIIIPVPLADARFRERGFNQAIEIGRRVELHLGIPLRADVVTRCRETREQAGLDSKERRRNLRRAFSVLGKLPAKHIAILDDVITTGSTMNELARTLRRAGARRIEAWAVARTSKS